MRKGISVIYCPDKHVIFIEDLSYDIQRVVSRKNNMYEMTGNRTTLNQCQCMLLSLIQPTVGYELPFKFVFIH